MQPEIKTGELAKEYIESRIKWICNQLRSEVTEYVAVLVVVGGLVIKPIKTEDTG